MKEYVLRIKYKGETEWKYVNARDEVSRAEMNRLNVDFSHFIIDRETLDRMHTNLVSYRDCLEAIAKVKCNVRYKPYTEHEVLEYREFK